MKSCRVFHEGDITGSKTIISVLRYSESCLFSLYSKRHWVLTLFIVFLTTSYSSSDKKNMGWGDPSTKWRKFTHWTGVNGSIKTFSLASSRSMYEARGHGILSHNHSDRHHCFENRFQSILVLIYNIFLVTLSVFTFHGWKPKLELNSARLMDGKVYC